MRRPLIPIALGTVLAISSFPVKTAAQPPSPPVGPVIRPAFSPYLNLARQNGNPAVSYYGIVRPQIQIANQVQALQTLAAPLTESVVGGDQPLVTGNPFGFQNYRSYFQNQFVVGGVNGVAQPGMTLGSQFPVQPGVVPMPRRR
jgi:hypothetical protein